MLKKIFLLVFFFLFILILKAQNKDTNIDLKIFELKNTSIRAIEVVNDSTVWFAGARGKIGRIINSEVEMDSIIFNDTAVNFRSIAYNGKYIFVLSVENPALLFKIDPFTNKITAPKIVYQENHEKVKVHVH